ncbi:MAG: TonB-dependent receptor [Gemmatimonadota bacterium]|nr:TonB-dependent receptor [Gemmatimonadota bacterium]
MSRLLAGLAVFVLFAVAVPTAEAQTGKLTGVVTDAQSGVPLEGAQLILQGTGITALTGSNGRYFLVNVPPGTYTVLVRRIGYSSAEVRNVFIQIDVTRQVDVELAPTGAVGVEEIVVSAEEVPLVQPGVTGTGSNIRAEEISALPVTNIQGVLALQQGFIAVPQNTDIISFSESRRNPITPVRVRGGRGGETLSMIDGIPVNNFVFGGPAFDITNEAVEQVDFQRGGFEAQYGNALSGIINIATREGGTNLAGSMNYQTSAIGGALGSTPDELSDQDLFQGYLSGPIPGTGQRLRFMAAGRLSTGADRVLQFDDDVARASGRLPDKPPFEANAHPRDLYPGWRAFGYDNISDLTGKLTYYFTPTAKLSVEGIRYERQRLPFDFDWMLTGFFPLEAPAVTNIDDSLARQSGSGIITQPELGQAEYYNVVQGSIFAERTMFAAKWDHTLGRWAYKARAGRFEQRRETCSFWQGVCLGNRFADYNFSDQFVAPIQAALHPTAGTETIFGGEDLTTTSVSADIQGQATDHHAIQFGGSYNKHDLTYTEWLNVGTNDVLVVPSYYAAKPWEAALYIQDKIEYDFLTVKVGMRFDFGKAGGPMFVDPRDPTNGTTAREICEANPDRYNYTDPGTGQTLTGFAACGVNRDLLSQATIEAQGDDFVQSGTRTQWSPRIGVSFPLSERSMVFFNFGRYSQNPLYNNVYSNTGIGTVGGSIDQGGSGVCDSTAVVPGSNQCYPIIYNEWAQTPFLGNPNLLIEKTTSYEMGFATEIGDQFALQVTAFSKDQFGLTGVRAGGQSPSGQVYFDVGGTYGTSIYNYVVMVNQDFQTVRGFEVNLRRRLFNYWGFNINFGFQQATTNAAGPELEFQRQEEEGDPQNLKEITSEVDIPVSANASIFFRVANENAFGVGILDAIVRNANLTFSFSARSGFPYTPTLSFTGFGDSQLQQNSGRAPGVFNVDLLAGKDFNLTNMRWGLFMRVSNLLNARNCQQVYASTGDCDGGTVDQSRRRNGNTVGEGASTTFFDRAHYFSAGRSINFGARLSF